MVWHYHIGILLLVPLIALPLTEDAFADGILNAKPDIFIKLNHFVEDVRLAFATGTEKAKLAVEFAENAQKKQDELFKKGKKIPVEIEERRVQLLKKAQPNEASITLFDRVKQDLQTISELNEIRILYSQFPDCIKNCTDRQKKEFNNRVNSLETWQNKCSGEFDIENYRHTDESFNRLAELQCPDLQNYPRVEILKAVKGSA